MSSAKRGGGRLRLGLRLALLPGGAGAVASAAYAAGERDPSPKSMRATKARLRSPASVTSSFARPLRISSRCRRVISARGSPSPCHWGTGAGSLAKQMCICVFVAKRSAEDCRADQLPALDPIEYEVRASQARVWAGIAWLGERTALHREGFGCTLE